MKDMSVIFAKIKYGLKGFPYNQANTWKELSENPLPENLIREYADKIDWDTMSWLQSLPEDIIRDFEDKLDWEAISYASHLSEDFIREYQDKVNWERLSESQPLSEDFIREFSDKLNLERILQNYEDYDVDVSESFKNELKELLEQQEEIEAVY